MCKKSELLLHSTIRKRPCKQTFLAASQALRSLPSHPQPAGLHLHCKRSLSFEELQNLGCPLNPENMRRCQPMRLCSSQERLVNRGYRGKRAVEGFLGRLQQARDGVLGLLLEDRSNKSSHAAHAANRHMQTSPPWPRRGRPGVCGVGDLIPHHLSTPMVTHCFFLSSLPAFPPLFHRFPPLYNFIPSPPSVLPALLGTRPARQPDEPLARDTVDL